MSNKIKISIPNPCHENWQTMTVVDKGRFCDSCQKTVTDFTKISDREIIDIFNKNDNLCGRFNASQLNRDLIKPKEKSTLWIAASTAIISFFTVGNQDVAGQDQPETIQTDKKVISENEILNYNGQREISGIVIDNENIPLPKANIIIKGTKTGIQTDIDGKFSIKAKVGVVLIVSFNEMEGASMVVGKDNFYNIKMLNSNVLGGAVIEFKKRSFFGKIFHKTGNLFR